MINNMYGLTLLLGVVTARAAIVPPPWANPGQNPCASRPGGWQLLYWPGDGECYKIFHQGPPCPPSMELTPGLNRTAECRCPPGKAQHEEDKLCYTLYTTDPCPQGQYFAPVSTPRSAGEKNGERWGSCHTVTPCPHTGELFYPRDNRCYTQYTQGPCPRGQLIAPGYSQSPIGQCRCDDNGRLARYYWPASGTCHPHFTPGPCQEKGTLFLPEGKCGCHQGLQHYHQPTNQCYQIGTVGPCPAGHHFTLPQGSVTQDAALTQVIHAECRCKDGHVHWPQDNNCYRPFTRGPCAQGQMFSVNIQGDNTTASCELLPCLPGRLYFPGGKGCHRVGTRGPCPPGQVVLFQDSVKTSVEGISYQGMCGCPTQSHDDRSFYPTLRADERSHQSGRCEAQGRSDNSVVEARSSSSLADRCQSKRGYISWTDGSCQQLYVRGPCAPGQWVVPDHAKGRRQGRGSAWRQGKCECLPSFTATMDSTGHISCLPPTVSLAHYLNTQVDAAA